ncbi:MAG: metallophosphoesterase [Halobacteriota archaeon]|nr:metallophosphoesterase [Halobacteriota archaeon]
MKFLLTGDLHLTDKSPKKRIDDFVKAQNSKMMQIIDIYKGQKCECILQPGDLFDSHKASDYIKQFWMNIFKTNKVDLFCVFGQHDLRYHTSNIDNTPIRVLNRAGNVHILNQKPEANDWGLDIGFAIYGQSWFEKTPKIKEEGPFNILVVHKQFYTSKKDWPTQDQEGTNATSFLKKHPFDLVVAGDNHRFFKVTYKNQTLLNLGSLMRTKIDQANHKPRVAIFDTETREIKIIKLDVKPFEKVFDMAKEKEEEERSESLQTFIKELKTSTKSKKLDFISKLKDARDTTDEGVAQVLDQVMQKAELKWK